MLTMLQATVNHEMVTPLQCIVSFAKSLDKELIHSDKRRNAQLISLTASLVLSQVKLMLDKSLLENDRFVANFQDCPINRVIADVVIIMSEQA